MIAKKNIKKFQPVQKSRHAKLSTHAKVFLRSKAEFPKLFCKLQPLKKLNGLFQQDYSKTPKTFFFCSSSAT